LIKDWTSQIVFLSFGAMVSIYTSRTIHPCRRRVLGNLFGPVLLPGHWRNLKKLHAVTSTALLKEPLTSEDEPWPIWEDVEEPFPP